MFLFLFFSLFDLNNIFTILTLLLDVPFLALSCTSWYPNLVISHSVMPFDFCRPLSNGQRGEVYEVNGDQVAVILDNSGNKPEEGSENEKSKEHCSKSPIYWIDSMCLFHY